MTKRKTNKRRKALKRRVNFILLNIVGYPILWVVLRVWPWMLRYKMNGAERLYELMESGRPLIFAFWHGQLLGIYWNGRQHVRADRINIMVSPSRDGRFLGRLLGFMGYRTVTGSSSSKGIAGLREMMEVLEKGDYAAIAVDGPRGPRHEVKSGPLFLARHTGAVIIPVIYHFEKKWAIRSWDRLEVPRPFSTIHVDILHTLEVPSKMDHEHHLDQLRKELEDGMIAALETGE
jgi:lysophospholipid acyltransferase (LPLAT)-like uncharacterized protein